MQVLRSLVHIFTILIFYIYKLGIRKLSGAHYRFSIIHKSTNHSSRYLNQLLMLLLSSLIYV